MRTRIRRHGPRGSCSPVTLRTPCARRSRWARRLRPRTLPPSAPRRSCPTDTRRRRRWYDRGCFRWLGSSCATARRDTSTTPRSRSSRSARSLRAARARRRLRDGSPSRSTAHGSWGAAIGAEAATACARRATSGTSSRCSREPDCAWCRRPIAWRAYARRQRRVRGSRSSTTGSSIADSIAISTSSASTRAGPTVAVPFPPAKRASRGPRSNARTGSG